MRGALAVPFLRFANGARAVGNERRFSLDHDVDGGTVRTGSVRARSAGNPVMPFCHATITR